MSRAHQLDLMLSVSDSVTLQADRDRAEAAAQEHYDRAEALAEENDGLKARLLQVKAALQAEQARALELERELILAQTLARTWEVQLKLWQRTARPTPHATPSKDVLTDLLVLAHPDKWQGQNAEVLAHEISIVLNDLRNSRVGGQA